MFQIDIETPTEPISIIGSPEIIAMVEAEVKVKTRQFYKMLTMAEAYGGFGGNIQAISKVTGVPVCPHSWQAHPGLLGCPFCGVNITFD
jgi:hypothetical protein